MFLVFDSTYCHVNQVKKQKNENKFKFQPQGNKYRDTYKKVNYSTSTYPIFFMYILRPYCLLLVSGKPSGSRRKGRPRKAGVLNLDDGPSSSSKANEKATSRSKDEGSKSDVKLKDDAKSTVDNADKSTSKTGSQKKDNVHKFIRNSIGGTPKSASKLMDDTVSAVSKVRKDTSKSKSSEDSPKTGQKLRGTTSPTTGSESEANIDFEKGKAKVRESETLAELPSCATTKAPESEASAGKKRKRRGQT